MSRPGPKPRLESPQRFSVTLPAALVDSLDAVAATLGRSRSEVLRAAVENGLPGLDASMFRRDREAR